MRLPQSPVVFKQTILAIVLVSSLCAAPAVAQDEENRPTLFSCGTDPAADKGFLDLSGIEQEPGVFTGLRFERRADGDGSLAYAFPPAGDASKTAFLFSHSDGPEGYLVSIRWRDDDADYVYYSLDVPPDPEVADDKGGGSAGLAISRNGELVERVSCAERPHMFISYMRDAMSCDLDNPYGADACGESSFERQTPLDVGRIGIVPAG